MPVPSYADADTCIKKFTEDGNFDHVIDAIGALGSGEAFRHPVINLILSKLRLKYTEARWENDIQQRKIIENYARKIGMAALWLKNLNSNPYERKFMEPTKVRTLLRRLQSFLWEKLIKKQNKKQNKTITLEDVDKHRNETDPWKHIEKQYQKFIESNKTFIKERKELRKQLRQKNEAIKEYQRRKSDDAKKLLPALKEDKKSIKSKLKKLETKGHEEATDTTITYLADKTGIQISKRALKNLLTSISKASS